MSVWRLTQVLVSYICAQVFLQRTTKRLASVREYCIEDVLVMAREGNLRRARRLRLVEERLVDTVAVLVILVQRLQANVVQNRVPLRQQFPQVFLGIELSLISVLWNFVLSSLAFKQTMLSFMAIFKMMGIFVGFAMRCATSSVSDSSKVAS
jgi:hypothetical protein